MGKIDRAKFGPPDDTAIMPWYGGAYSHGFVALHPFFIIEGLNPDTCEHGTLVLSGSSAPSELGLLEWAAEEAADRRLGKEITAEGVDGLAKRFGQRVDWRTIFQQANFIDHCDLDRALRSSIGGLRYDLADAAASDRLGSYCSQHGIFPPQEGRFEPIMQSGLAKLFRRAGFLEVIVGDEFGDDERLVDISLLEREELWDGMAELPQYGIKRLIAPDYSLLAWVHWDSFYTLIFGTVETFHDMNIDQFFEGFWCSDETNTYWLTQACIPLVQ
jgi:hypothetical protein